MKTEDVCGYLVVINTQEIWTHPLRVIFLNLSAVHFPVCPP